MSGCGPVHVAGAGGHAKVVVATLRAAGFDVRFAWDDDATRVGGAILGVPIKGCIDEIPRDVSLVVAVGLNSGRKAVVERLQGRNFVSVIHPTATIDPSVVFGPGSVVFAGAVIQAEAQLGAHVIVNTGASIDHDCILEDFVHAAPGVHLAGNVLLREGAFLGIGACAVPGVEVGVWATVGAGGVIVRSIPARVTAVGCPARPQSRVAGAS